MPPARPRHNPHDRLFRFVYSTPLHARPTLRCILGEPLADRFDWSTLKLEPGSYLDERLKGSASDLLFSVCLRGDSLRALAYLLWDHQSTPDAFMPLRLLTYGGRALLDYTERCDAIPGYLPPLIPVLLYQGRAHGPDRSTYPSSTGNREDRYLRSSWIYTCSSMSSAMTLSPRRP